MSHFSVLVIGKNVDEQLAPFHEFECSGIDNEFVQDLDVTEEIKKAYEEGRSTRLEDPDGKLHYPYDDRFYREPTEEEQKHIGIGGSGCTNGFQYSSKDWKDGRGYRPKVKFIPDGWKEIKVPYSKLETFAQYANDDGKPIVPFTQSPDLENKHKYGYTLVDANGEVIKIVDRTNPNKKWDWYVIGGRWGGYFKLKPGRKGKLGSPSTFDKLNGDSRDHSKVDQALKKDIDFEGMRLEAREDALQKYDKLQKLFYGEIPKIERSWKEIGDDQSFKDWDERRKYYHSQPGLLKLADLKKNADSMDIDKETRDWLFWVDLEDFQCTREAYGKRAHQKAISTFAVVKNSKWYERGEMGWWGSVSDEKDENEWLAQFEELLLEVPDETLLTVVDCHI